MNALKIGMLFGNGIELGIGIDTHPDIDTAASINNTIRTTILALFLKFGDKILLLSRHFFVNVSSVSDRYNYYNNLAMQHPIDNTIISGAIRPKSRKLLSKALADFRSRGYPLDSRLKLTLYLFIAGVNKRSRFGCIENAIHP